MTIDQLGFAPLKLLDHSGAFSEWSTPFSLIDLWQGTDVTAQVWERVDDRLWDIHEAWASDNPHYDFRSVVIGSIPWHVVGPFENEQPRNETARLMNVLMTQDILEANPFPLRADLNRHWGCCGSPSPQGSVYVSLHPDVQPVMLVHRYLLENVVEIFENLE